MEILFLGTGAAVPSKYRNVTATYLHMFAHGGMLLDCGEGTYGQLRRRYGAAGANRIITGLKCVWISHIHADHHAGLGRWVLCDLSQSSRTGTRLGSGYHHPKYE